MTQCERVLRHLEDYGEIDQLTALQEYGIMRLASRVSDLRRRGVFITSDFATGRNRYGEPTKWAVYRLEKEKQA